MALHKEPSLFARCLTADRTARLSTTPTLESFLWPSCCDPQIPCFQFDTMSPDDEKLALQNQSIQAAHHKKKPEGSGGASKPAQSKTFKSFSKRKAAAPAEAMTSLEGPIAEMSITRQK